MKHSKLNILASAMMAGAIYSAVAGTASAETLTIATVNNGDMIRMQKLADDFTDVQVAIEALPGSGAEAAVERAADLR